MGPVGSGTTGGDAPRMLRGCSDDNKMRINSTLRKTRTALIKIPLKIYMCIDFRVYFLIRLTIYRSVRIYLYLCRYASMYIYISMYIWIDLSVRRFGNKMSIKSNLRKTRPIHQQTLRHLCMCFCTGVFINSYRYLCICWYLALSMYVCLYVYIQLCIYRFFYLSEGLTTK